MDDLDKRLALAAEDSGERDRLLRDYLPFLKKLIGSLKDLALEYDDMLSMAMLVFVNCVRQYEIGKGHFLSFVQVCVRNRLIDESRKERKNHQVIAFPGGDRGDLRDTPVEEAVSLRQYDRTKERQRLCEEIDGLNEELSHYGILFSQLPKICPKQDRARRQCLEIALAVNGDSTLRSMLTQRRQLPQRELAERFSLSPKTIEKHRKYIVTLAVLLQGDYPGIQAFLPQGKEMKP